MSRFKIGQRVVWIADGSEFIVDGFSYCKGCGIPTIMLVGYNRVSRQACGVPNGSIGCGFVASDFERNSWAEKNFAPLEEIESAIENLMEQSNLITK